MKNLKEYIIEKNASSESESTDNVWIVKDKDLDGAILDVCPTEKEAKDAYDFHMKENDKSNLEIEKIKRSEVEK